jgi:hypothetical protein
MVVPQLMRLSGQYDIAEAFDKEVPASGPALGRGRTPETL